MKQYTIIFDLYEDDVLLRRTDVLNVPTSIESASQMYDWLRLAIQALQGLIQY